MREFILQTQMAITSKDISFKSKEMSDKVYVGNNEVSKKLYISVQVLAVQPYRTMKRQNTKKEMNSVNWTAYLE